MADEVRKLLSLSEGSWELLTVLGLISGNSDSWVCEFGIEHYAFKYLQFMVEDDKVETDEFQLLLDKLAESVGGAFRLMEDGSFEYSEDPDADDAWIPATDLFYGDYGI